MNIRNQGWMLVAVICLLFLGGCTMTPKYDILVNGYLDHDKEFGPGSAFYVIQNEEAANALFEKELAGKVNDLITEAGYRVASLEDADFCIRFYYGTGTGTQIKTEYIDDPFMHYHFHGYHRWYGGCWGYHPSPRIVNKVSMLYHHGMSLQILEAEPYRKDGTEEIAWVGETSCSTSLPDLRTALHFMFKALFKYFGEDTQVGRIVTLEHMLGVESEGDATGDGDAGPDVDS